MNLALEWEDLIYTTFVKNVEDEAHYQQCFADWMDELAALGRRFSDQVALSSDGADRVAFFLHSGHRLGHTEILLKMLESRPRAGDHGLEPRVYILNLYDPDFVERVRAAGVDVVRVIDDLGRSAPVDARFLWLRERFKLDRVGVCVRVSVPTMAAFALSMRLAPVQIFWALRFHPTSGPYIDGYITWGNLDEKTRRYGNQEWQVVPLPFAIDDSPPDPAKINELRRRFPESVLLGTLAREEKINSEPFLQAVADILAANPQAGYLWTGRSKHPGIAGFFRAAGVAERCHFVGWVDNKLYAAALDVFLESFPYGFGIIGYQAFAAARSAGPFPAPGSPAGRARIRPPVRPTASPFPAPPARGAASPRPSRPRNRNPLHSGPQNELCARACPCAAEIQAHFGVPWGTACTAKLTGDSPR